MRRVLATLFAALLVAALPAFGQFKDRKAGGWELEAGTAVSVYDSYYSEIGGNGGTSLPTLSIRSGYKFPGTFVGVFLSVYGRYAGRDLTGGPSLLREREAILHVLPEVRFYYLDDPDFRLYATVGAGVRYRQFAETLEGDTITNHEFRFSYEISPFGVSVGDGWSFSVDVGYGIPWTIAKIGVGYRF